MQLYIYLICAENLLSEEIIQLATLYLTAYTLKQVYTDLIHIYLDLWKEFDTLYKSQYTFKKYYVFTRTTL